MALLLPLLLLLLLLLLPLLLGSCKELRRVNLDDAGSASRCDGAGIVSEHYFPQSVTASLDLLFVIDNSASMADEQLELVASFPRLVEQLRMRALGGDIPDLHVGVVSTDLGDLGAATAQQTSCAGNGDNALLQHAPRVPGCTPPADPWISYVDYRTNIPGGSGDPAAQVAAAFACIAPLGTSGCAFEQPLQAARRALDPQLNLNPGFLRQNALLFVVLVTDEDDCSARLASVYDPSSAGADVETWTALRCFDQGVACDQDASSPGVKTGCAPAGSQLEDVAGYVSFFEQLKPPGRVFVSAVAAAADTVEIVDREGQLALGSGCQDGAPGATPATRLGQLIEQLGHAGRFVSICDGDLAPAIGPLPIVQSVSRPCVGGPLLTTSCELACDDPCQGGCLPQVDCEVEEVTGLDTPLEREEAIQRCPAALFDPQLTDCGASCPCWRLVPDRVCSDVDGHSARFEILRQYGRVPRDGGRLARVRCTTLAPDRPPQGHSRCEPARPASFAPPATS